MSSITDHIDPLLASVSRNAEALSDIKGDSVDTILPDILRIIRVNLGFDLAIITEFSGPRSIIRYADAAEGMADVLQIGCSDLLDSNVRQQVVKDPISGILQSAAEMPEAIPLPVTAGLPVRTQLSVPIQFKDGYLFGTFCCFSREPALSPSANDLKTMHTFAQLAGCLLEVATADHRIRQDKIRRIENTLEQSAFSTVYQPIVQLSDGAVVGYEALTRFDCDPTRSPDQWFADAVEVELDCQLECAASRKAVSGLDRLPPDVYLSVNVSPEAVLACKGLSCVADRSPERIVIEITEHSSIENYSEIAEVLAPLREKGVRLAVDDAGAGYASFRHILELRPDIIKLDRSLIHDLNTRQDQRALTEAIVLFAKRSGIQIVAEGVETEAELEALRQLNIDKVQGFLLGRPAPITDIAPRRNA